jgi:hypothetical protein
VILLVDAAVAVTPAGASGAFSAKFAVTVLSPSMRILVEVVVAFDAPDQRENRYPLFGLAVRVTIVPALYPLFGWFTLGSTVPPSAGVALVVRVYVMGSGPLAPHLCVVGS